MRIWPAACLAVGVCGGISSIRSQGEKIETLVLYGNVQGSLAPCGCTSPMSGGIVRAATVLKELSKSQDAHLLFLGGYVTGRDRQDELKAETMGEFAHLTSAFGMEFSTDLSK